jgi:hypothetical protein
MNLAFAANTGNIEDVNLESVKIQAVQKTGIENWTKTIIAPERCSTMFYGN